MNKDAHVTVEQARVLDALVRRGTLVAASKELGKGHSAVLYTLRTLEDAIGLRVLDRSGYRLRLTPAGERVLEALRELLAAEARVAVAVHEVRTGWEPRLTIVVDGVCPTERVFEIVADLTRAAAPTRIEVVTEFLSGVEETFEARRADLMISVLGAASAALVATPLPPFRAYLVAHRRHPLALAKKVSRADLEGAVLLTVRGSDPRLSLPTAGIAPVSQVLLNDFASKKTALMARVGYGWMPEHLCARELERGELVRLGFGKGSQHAFVPTLYRRRSSKPGRATSAVLAALTA